MSPNESNDGRWLDEAIRGALPPLPSDFDPERIEDEFFAALAKENVAVGLKPPDIGDRLVALARQEATVHRANANRRSIVSPRLRRIAAAAAAVAAIAGLAGAATVAIRAALRDNPPPAPPPASSIVRRSSIGVDAPDSAEPDTTKPESSIAPPVVSPPVPEPAKAVSAEPAAPASSAEDVPSASAAPEDAFAFYRPADVETFLAAWQESLLPLSSAVTQEVGAVAIVPDGADSAAWFAALWPDRAPETFSALLLDDLGDAVLTNLAASAAATVEAPEDYDPAWLLDETLPGIPEEHRRALMPFYDPALVTLSFDSYPDAARFAEWLGNGGDPPAPSRTAPSSAPQALLSFEPEAHPSSAQPTAPSPAPQTLLSFEPKAPQSSAPEQSRTPPPMPDFKLLQRLLYRELVVPFYDGPDGSTYLSSQGAREVWRFALALGRGTLAQVPNREWGGAYDLVVRSGLDDPFLRFCASLGSWKWGWTDKARELRDDFSFRLAGGDATPLQTLLLAHLDQRFEPSPDRTAALRAAFDAWSATLSGEFDRADVRAWIKYWLVEDIVATDARSTIGKESGGAARADATARSAAEAAPNASPAPGTVPIHEDFVQETFLPLVLREVVAPLEALERDRDAPWRPIALAALRDWCLWTVRGEDRPDPLYMGRAVSAAGRGCPWPAIRFLAALKDYDDTAWDPETAVYGRDNPAAIAAAAHRVVESLAGADAAPDTTPFARLLMHRAAAGRRHPAVQGLSAQTLGAAFLHAIAAAQSWPPAEIRALWLLAPDTADWPAIASSASDPWLREMALGRAALTQGDAAKSTAARSGAAQSTTTQSGAAQSTAARSGAARAPLAREAFARAAELQPAFPEPWIELLRHCAADPAEARAFYDEAARREFDAPGAADAMLDALRPASPAGAVPSAPASAEALLAFGDECLATGRFDTRVPFAWARSRFIAASLPGADWEAPFRGKEAITNMNRVCDARLANPLSSKDDRSDAIYARIWPLYANNDFENFVAACVALSASEGKRHGFAADFDSGHPMRRRAIGIAYGCAGPHHDDVVDAMRAWRVDGDLAAARDAFRARAGCVSAATNTLDNWEQSLISGHLAVLDRALASPDDPPYSLLPKFGKPGPRKFWRSRAETVRFYTKNKVSPECGVWWTDERAGQIAASDPVLPTNTRLSIAVGLNLPTNPVPARFWIVPEAVADPSPSSGEPALGLLLESDDHCQCTLGWARLRLFDPDSAPVGEADGPRVRVQPPADGIQLIELDLVGGDVIVRYGGRPLPELRRPGLVAPDRAHTIAFAGRLFILFKATVLALPPEPIAVPESNAAELTDANRPL